MAVSQALMLAMSSGSLEAEAGLHFQLPPTMGRRDISLLAEESDERSSVGVARSISGARDAQSSRSDGQLLIRQVRGG